MAHVVDSETKEFLDYGKAFEEQRQMEADAIGAILSDCKYIEEHDFMNMEKQSGRKLTEENFESRVKKLNPNITFVTRNPTDGECDYMEIPHGSQVKVVFQKLPNEELKYLASYERRPLLSEFDVVKLRSRIIQRIANTDRENMITELPKFDVEVTPDGHKKYNWLGLNNLQQQVWEPCGRVIGWRTVLAISIIKGALELEKVEREFDAADNAAWALKTGKKATDFKI